MTIFRVNIERDQPQVVKSLKKEDPELTKIIDEWGKATNSFDEFMRKNGPKIMQMSRRVYKLTDKKLKGLARDKNADKNTVALVKDIRKHAYDLTVHIKKHLAY